MKFPHTDPGFLVPGYPQMMQGQHFSPDQMKKIDGRRETRGMRHNWHMGIKAMMTVVRVLPDDLYDRLDCLGPIGKSRNRLRTADASEGG